MPVEIHQIAEHHRDMTSLASLFRCRPEGRSHGRLRLPGPERGNRRFGNRCVVELGNRCQHLSAMPKQDPDVL